MFPDVTACEGSMTGKMRREKCDCAGTNYRVKLVSAAREMSPGQSPETQNQSQTKTKSKDFLMEVHFRLFCRHAANELRQQEKETGWFKESNMSGMNHSCKSSLTMEDNYHRDPLDCNKTLF